MNLALGVLLATGLAAIVTGAAWWVIRASRSATLRRGQVRDLRREHPLGGELPGAIRIETEDSDQWAARGLDSIAP
jgi:hypothetical protein